MLKEEVILAGFGGQGIVFAGSLLIDSCMRSGYNVVGFPSYGIEMRGGTACYSCVISDTPIGSPIISSPDSLIIMNEQSFYKFSPRLKEKGLLLINSSMTKKVDISYIKKKVLYVGVQATELAQKCFNTVFVANMIILGAYIKIKKFISKEILFTSLYNLLKRKDLYEINKAALNKGIESVGAL